MTYEQIVSELEDNQSFGNIRKSIWDSCVVIDNPVESRINPRRL